MENLPEQSIEPKEQKSELQVFRDEIAALKEEVERDKLLSGKPKIAHFIELNIDELTADDMNLWRKFKDRTLELEEFRAYRNEVSKNKDRHSSHEFAAYIANQALYWAEKMHHDK